MDNSIIFSIFFCVFIIFLIASNPRWLKIAYFIWFLFLIFAVQITYNELSRPKDLSTKIFTGKDDNYLQAQFKIYMLNDKFSWKFKSDDTVQINGEDITPELLINSLEINQDIDNSLAIICIGNSSHEGNPIEEEKRAIKRSAQIAKWLQQFYPTIADKIHVLNLGVNQIVSHDTAAQRRLIIISLLSKDDNVNIKQALKNGLSEEDILPFNIKDYSTFEFK